MRRSMCLAAVVGLCLAATGWAGDQETAQQIAASLKSSGQLKGYSVGVKVQDGTAWLNGTVVDEAQLAAALSIAQQTPGVDRVVNNLAIGTAQPAGAPSSGLRQPASVAGGAVPYGTPVAATKPRAAGGVVQTTMELPGHAQDQLQVAGPMSPDTTGDVTTTAANAIPNAQGYGPMGAHPGYAQPGYGPQGAPQQFAPQGRRPMPLPVSAAGGGGAMMGPGGFAPGAMGPGGEVVGAPQPLPQYGPGGPGSPLPYKYDHPQMPGYAWPSYAAYPNYAAVTYPKQYSPTAWPYIGPFYPYPQVPLGWRKVTLEWDDGWWFLDFKDSH